MDSRKRIDICLPDEMTIEILLKLPVKSLLRFKCVCKKWLAHIVDQSFIENHFQGNSNKERPLLCSYKPETRKNVFVLYSDETFSEHEEPESLTSQYAVVDLVGLFNGFCCIVYQNSISAMLIMVNLATRERKPIPSLHDTIPPYLFNIFTVFGLGPDPCDSSRHFKLVMLHFVRDASRHDTLQPFLIGVYTSVTDSWRLFEHSEVINSSCHVSRSLCDTCLDGVYYWRIKKRIGTNATAGIIAFDMKTECFCRLPPVPDSVKLKSSALGLCLDSIALFSCDIYTSQRSGSIDVWLMERDRSWVKRFSVWPPEGIGLRRPLGIWKKDGVVFEYDNRVMILYNLITRDFKILPGWSCFHVTGYSILSYKESLISLQLGNGG